MAGQVWRVGFALSLWLVGCAPKAPAPPAQSPVMRAGGTSEASLGPARNALEAGQKELDRGSADAAAGWAESALAELERQNQLGTDIAAELYRLLGRAHVAKKSFEPARDAFTKELAIRKRLEPRDPLRLAMSLNALANVCVQTARFDEARAFVNEALPLVKPGGEPEDRRICELQMTLAESYRYGSALPEAIEAFSKAVQIAQRHESTMARLLVEAMVRLAATQERLGKKEAAVVTTESALTVALRNDSLSDRILELAESAAHLQHELDPNVPTADLLARYGARSRTFLVESGKMVDGVVEPSEPVAPETSSATASASPEPGAVSYAARVVAAMRSGFRTCYNAGLKKHPELQGSVRLTLRVGPSGLVKMAIGTSISLPAEVVDCVLFEAGTGQFAPPEGGSAVINIPLTFVRQ